MGRSEKKQKGVVVRQQQPAELVDNAPSESYETPKEMAEGWGLMG